MSSTGLDFNTDGEIFRHDNVNIIARNMHHTSIIPVRVDCVTGGLKAGQAMGRVTTGGHYAKYDKDNLDGTEVCVGFLKTPVSQETGTDVAQVIVKGELFNAKLVDVDATAIASLNARVVTDGTGTEIFIF
jgi:hypothetical protein